MKYTKAFILLSAVVSNASAAEQIAMTGHHSTLKPANDASARPTIAGANRATSGNRYLPADQIPWAAEGNAPVELGPLWGDRAKGEAGTLLRTQPGFRSGPHSHTADYWAVVVQGSWEHLVPSTGEGKGIRLDSGAHWTQVKTQLHEDACVSDVPCIIFLFNKTPYITKFPKAPAQ